VKEDVCLIENMNYKMFYQQNIHLWVFGVLDKFTKQSLFSW